MSKSTMHQQLQAAEQRMRVRLDAWKRDIRAGNQPADSLADISREMKTLKRRFKATKP